MISSQTMFAAIVGLTVLGLMAMAQGFEYNMLPASVFGGLLLGTGLTLLVIEITRLGRRKDGDE